MSNSIDGDGRETVVPDDEEGVPSPEAELYAFPFSLETLLKAMQRGRVTDPYH